MRDGRWKFLTNPDGSESWLFDLKQDPSEKTNLLQTEANRARRMFEAVGAWANEVGYEFDRDASPSPTGPKATALLNNQLVRFDNHGVKVDEEGAWHFDGSGHLSLPRFQAPKVSGDRWVRITARIEQSSPAGVILAHGGDKTGYSIYMADGKLSFSVCADWQRTTIAAAEKIDHHQHQIQAYWNAAGDMQLKLDGKLVAKGQSPGYMQSEPGDSMQVGKDLIQPVGDYQGENSWQGILTDLEIKHPR